MEIMRFHFTLRPILNILLGFFISYFFFCACPNFCPDIRSFNNQKLNERPKLVIENSLAVEMERTRYKTTKKSNEHQLQNKLEAITSSSNNDQQITKVGEFDEESRYTILKHQKVLFIEGMPRSGTTLMRVLLDTDPNIYCGPETVFLVNLFMHCRRHLQEITSTTNTMNAQFHNE